MELPSNGNLQKIEIKGEGQIISDLPSQFTFNVNQFEIDLCDSSTPSNDVLLSGFNLQNINLCAFNLHVDATTSPTLNGSITAYQYLILNISSTFSSNLYFPDSLGNYTFTFPVRYLLFL